MPFKHVNDFEKSFPAVLKLSPKRKRLALEVFNQSKNQGDDDATAIAKALSTAKRLKLGEDATLRVLSLAALELTDEELANMEFQVLRTGEFYDARYGVFKVTDERLLNLKRNFDSEILGVGVALDLNHEPEHKAYAWVKALTIRGGGLWATFKDFTEEGKKFFLDKAFRYFSVEFGPFERAEGGKKMTVKDVLRGIALTNRPVIKGMEPTFLAEGVETNSRKKNTMSVQAIKLFAANLQGRAVVSKEDKTALNSMVAILSEDEKEGVAVEVAEVEKKPEEAPTAEKKPEEVAAAEGGKDGEACKMPDGGAGKFAKGKCMSEKDYSEMKASEAKDGTTLSEMEVKLAEAAKTIDALKASEAKRVQADRVKALTLSEENKTGFSAELNEKVSSFVVELSEEEYAKFSELVKSVTTVTEAMLSEMGHAKNTTSSNEEKNKQAVELAEKMAKEKNLPMHVALAEAYKQLNLVE